MNDPVECTPAIETATALIEGLHAQLPSPAFVLAGIEVALGALIGLTAEELRLELQRQLPGVAVIITLLPAIFECLDCGAEYPADEHPCPVCGSPNARVLHGEELSITRAWGSQG